MRGDSMSEVCVVFSKKDGVPVAEVPLNNAEEFVLGVEEAMRAVCYHTGVPAWRLLQALTGAATYPNIRQGVLVTGTKS